MNEPCGWRGVRVTAEGQVLDSTYRLTRLVAEGGMGLVYEATHARLAGRYAIKVLPQKWSKDPDAIARFDREARITSSLQHPNIVQIIDCNTAPDGTEYLVMEYLRGETLAARLARLGAMSLDAVVPIVEQIASGLAAAHAHGIIHRDLKPENILLMQVEGRDDDWAKILDFGISKVTDDSLGTIGGTNSLIGTPQYMAPEQCEGRTKDVGAATDEFALAVITYEMLTGRRPFAGGSLGEVLYQVLHADPPPMNIDPAVEAVVRRGLAKTSGSRYPSVAAFAEALRAAASADRQRGGDRLDEWTGHRDAAGGKDRSTLKGSPRRSPSGAVLVAAVVITVTVGTAFVVAGVKTRRPPTSLDRATSASASSTVVVPTTSTELPQAPPPSVPAVQPRDAPALSSLGDRGVRVPSRSPRAGLAVTEPANQRRRTPVMQAAADGTRRQVFRKPAPLAPPSAAPTRAVVAPMKEQANASHPPPFRPLPADEDAILPPDDTFNDRP
jgi:eukaryotic-like serine/threonine-protein kinase